MWIKQLGCDCPGCGSGPCDPPTAADPTLVCEAGEIVESKSDHAAYTEYCSPSSPPKYYTTETRSGTLYLDGYDGPGCTDFVETITDPDCAQLGGTNACDLSEICDSGIQKRFVGNNDCAFQRAGSPYLYEVHRGTTTDTLSDEYTTAELEADAAASLAAAGYSGTGDCWAVRDLAANEVTLALRKLRYKFTLPTLTGYSCYRITWQEGGVAKEYVWDGVATETGWYEVSPPAGNGTIEVTSVAGHCDGC